MNYYGKWNNFKEKSHHLKDYILFRFSSRLLRAIHPHHFPLSIISLRKSTLWENLHCLHPVVALLRDFSSPLLFCISFLSVKYSHAPNWTQCEQFTLNWDENCLSTFLFFLLIHLIVSAYHFHHLNKWNECYYNGMHGERFSLFFFLCLQI